MGWSGNSCTTAIHKSFIMHWLSLGVASFLVTDTVMGVRIVFGDLGDKLYSDPQIPNLYTRACQLCKDDHDII